MLFVMTLLMRFAAVLLVGLLVGLRTRLVMLLAVLSVSFAAATCLISRSSRCCNGGGGSGRGPL